MESKVKEVQEVAKGFQSIQVNLPKQNRNEIK